jgi:hypothetical protein
MYNHKSHFEAVIFNNNNNDLKPEWWGSPLAQEEKYQGRKKTCDKR